ncbi:MAG: GAF domain-containing protein, partial [Candidatus Rokuibacteriota bacterium]
LLDTATSRLRRLEALREIEREISQQHDPDELLGLIVRRATELLEADSATVFLLDERRQALSPHASFNAPAPVRDVTLRPGEGVAGRVALGREGMIVNDYGRSPYAIAPFREMDAAVAAQPLLHGDAVRGVILVRRVKAHRRPFREADLVHLGDFAVQASIALENARLFRLASGRAERVRAAAEIGQLLVSTLDADRILDVIAEKCRDVLGAQAVGLFRLGPDGCLRYARGFGFDAAFMQAHVLRLGEGVAGLAALERRTVESTDVLADPAITLSAEARARLEPVGTRAIGAVPIVIRAEVLGVIAVYHPPGFRIPAEEREFLETLANHAAAALDNARLFEQTRRRQATAETLAALTQTLTGSLDLPTVLSLVADGVRRLLGCDGGAIGLTEPDGSIRLSVAVGLGAGAFRDTVIRPGQGVGGRVLERGEPFWTTDYQRDTRITKDFAEAVRATGIVGELGVPIRLREETVGVLWAVYGRAVEITEEDVALAADVAHVVAIAVENARLYQEARQREAEARAMVEVGRLISGSLDAERVLDLIVEKALALMGVPACGIFRLEADGRLRYVRGTGLTAGFITGLQVSLGEGTSGRSVAERAPVWTTDILTDPAVRLSPSSRALVAKEGFRGVLSVPIWLMDTAYGCLATYWWEPHRPGPGEVATLASLATFAAVALENARLYGETREHVGRLTRLNEVNRDLSTSLRLDEVLTKVAQAAGTFFGAPLVVVWVADDERRVLARRAGHGGDADLHARLPAWLVYGEGAAGWVAAHREALLDVPIETDPRVAGRDLLAAQGITALTGVPVLLGERLLGVVTIAGRRERPLAGADVALLQTLLGQAAIAIEHARLYEEAQRHEAEAVALAEASRRFGASLRREAIFDSVVETAARLLDGVWALLVVRPDGAAVRPRAPA